MMHLILWYYHVLKQLVQYTLVVMVISPTDPRKNISFIIHHSGCIITTWMGFTFWFTDISFGVTINAWESCARTVEVSITPWVLLHFVRHALHLTKSVAGHRKATLVTSVTVPPMPRSWRRRSSVVLHFSRLPPRFQRVLPFIDKLVLRSSECDLIHKQTSAWKCPCICICTLICVCINTSVFACRFVCVSAVGVRNFMNMCQWMWERKRPFRSTHLSRPTPFSPRKREFYVHLPLWYQYINKDKVVVFGAEKYASKWMEVLWWPPCVRSFA